MNPKLDEHYLDWLYRLVERPPNEFDEVDEGYWKLMQALFTIRFDVVVYKDRNRALDGIGLREDFIEQSDIPSHVFTDEWINTDASILEVIVALAKRMEFLTNTNIRECFWELMTNAGFDRYDDGAFEGEDVEIICGRIINREYQPDGRGGLFPLNTAHENQTNVELHYQMQYYIFEHML